jgi:O-antigen ligase
MGYQFLQKKCFLVAVTLLPFVLLPKQITLPLPGSNMLSHASVYPVLLGLLLWVMTMVKTKRWEIPRKYTLYAGVFLGWTLLTATIGIIQFPFYDQVDINKIQKMHSLLLFLKNQGLALSLLENSSVVILIAFKIIASILVHFLMTVGVAFWVYALYRDHPLQGLQQLRQGVLYSFFLVGSYSVIELFYLGGSGFAAALLQTINPLLFAINDAHGWWPPLLWIGQIRSLCLEPSYFGIYAAMATPFILSYFVTEGRYKVHGLIFFYLSFLVFMTKARTAIVLYLFELAAFLLLVLRCKAASCYRRLTVAATIVLIAGSAAANFTIADTAANELSRSSVLQTVASIVQPDSRSNTSRLTVQIANLHMALDHPVFGVGSHLSSAYFPQYAPVTAPNSEVSTWLTYQKTEGPFYATFDFNHFTFLLAETGLVGLLLYAFPLVWLVRKCYLLLKHTAAADQALLWSYLVALIGVSGALLSNSDSVFYSLYFLLGIGLILAEENSGERE